MTLTQGNLVKAKIINKSASGEEVECLFNPKEYAFEKQNEWEAGKILGKGMQPPTFKGGKPMYLTLQLWFDTYEPPPGQENAGGYPKDVRTVTGKLWKMMKLTETRRQRNTNVSEPPHVEFRWGDLWSFEAVITKINEKFTLFLPGGTPVRSFIDISFMQAKDLANWPATNPTSGAKPGYNIHMVKEGETIDWIAFSRYGASTAWRHLASANNLDDPSRLRPGQRLLIPPLNE